MELMRPSGPLVGRAMISTCPTCGAAAEFTSRQVRAVHGSCGACGGDFTIVEPNAPADAPDAPEEVSDPSSAGDGPEPGRTHRGSVMPSLSAPPCRRCGAPLALRSWTGESAEAACPSCGATVEYRTMPPRREPQRGPWRDFGGRGPSPPRSGPGLRGKPCRECGGPLAFSTDAAGVVTGECSSCGNRFTLPPRSTGRDPRGPRDRRERFSRGYSPRSRRPPGRRGEGEDRPGRARERPRRPFGRRPWGDDAEGDESRERRRRRSRDR